jgi:PmbA protein
MTMSTADPDQFRRVAKEILDLPGADGVEVVFTASETSLTRYARSQIIQNTVQHTIRAYVRVAVGNHYASASTNQLDHDHLSRAAASALEAARTSPEDPDFPGLPDPALVGRAEPVMRFDDRTAECSAERRARAVGAMLRIVDGSEAAGIFESSAHTYGVVSSTGIDCFDAYSRCIVSCLADLGHSTGYRELSSHSIDEVDFEFVARMAIDKARAGHDPIDIDPGTYEVVLEPAAVALLLEYLSYIGFGAKQVIDGESFLSVRAGDQVAAVDVTVADDVFHPLSVGIGFDLEGVPKRRMAVIDQGIAHGPVTDLRTARRLGVEASGHHSGSNEYGPWASNVVMDGASVPLEELIAGVERGLLVTRFHYVNVLDRPAALLTGMTRDGTWLIEKGELAKPVRNLRFTQSVLDALADVRGIGNDSEAMAPDYGSFGSHVAPSLRIGQFSFTSATSH